MSVDENIKETGELLKVQIKDHQNMIHLKASLDVSERFSSIFDENSLVKNVAIERQTTKNI